MLYLMAYKMGKTMALSTGMSLLQVLHFMFPLPRIPDSKRASTFFAQRANCVSQPVQIKRKAAGASGSCSFAYRIALGESSMGPLWQMPTHSILSPIETCSRVLTSGVINAFIALASVKGILTFSCSIVWWNWVYVILMNPILVM